MPLLGVALQEFFLQQFRCQLTLTFVWLKKSGQDFLPQIQCLPGSARPTHSSSDNIKCNTTQQAGKMCLEVSLQIKFVFDHSSIQQVFIPNLSAQGVAGLGHKKGNRSLGFSPGSSSSWNGSWLPPPSPPFHLPTPNPFIWWISSLEVKFRDLSSWPPLPSPCCAPSQSHPVLSYPALDLLCGNHLPPGLPFSLHCDLLEGRNWLFLYIYIVPPSASKCHWSDNMCWMGIFDQTSLLQIQNVLHLKNWPIMHRKEPLLSVLKILSQHTCKDCACKTSHKDKQWQERSEQKPLWHHCCYHIDDVNDVHYKKGAKSDCRRDQRPRDHDLPWHSTQRCVALDKSYWIQQYPHL